MAVTGKHICLTDYIELDNVGFTSSQIRSVEITSEDEQVDAGGFNAAGVTEYLPGQRTRQVTLEVYDDNAATNGVMATLYPLHRDKSEFYFRWRKDGNASASSSNPEWRGLVKMYSWSESATFGEVGVTPVTLISSATGGLEK